MLPRLAADALTNAGSVALARAYLVADGDGPDEQGIKLLEWARARFEQALAWNDNHLAAQWGLARTVLAFGRLGVGSDEEASMAADALHSLVTDGTHNSLLYQDTLTVFYLGNRPGDVIALYEGNPPVDQMQTISVTVALAYLQRSAPGDLQRALALHPNDLYADYQLWQAARGAGDVRVANILSDTLVYFPLEAVNPVDERLLDYAAETIPSLLDEGMWDREKVLRVASFLVWQHNETVSVERLLEQLVRRYPAEPDWLFCLAELYHRQGDLGRAEVAYRRVLAVDPEYTQAYLRLGMVAEEKSQISNPKSQELVREAAKWYEQYYRMVPDDLLGLKYLAEVCTALEEAREEDESCRQAALQIESQEERAIRNSPAAVLRETLEAYTDDRRIVAELLRVPAEAVELEPNLVENGGFEDWDSTKLTGWWVSDMATGGLWNKGLFVDRKDEFVAWEGVAGRVNGLWLQYRSDKEPGRSGYLQIDEKKLTTASPYVLSFYYRTTGVPDGAAAVWISDNNLVLFGHDHRLPATNGRWWRFTVVGWNRSGDVATVRLLLRSFMAGQVWFDDVQLRAVDLHLPVQPQESRLIVLTGD
jgi:tetratricopeptide (TPR) repeat protein